MLRNKLDITDQTALSVTERAHTVRQAQRIATSRLPIDRTFDASHLQAIHSALFSALYDWAGQFRTVDIRRGVNEFAQVADIPALLDQMHRQVIETDWGVRYPDVFAANIADTFVIVNFAHPFRDGNGRTTRIFLNHVAELSPFRLDFTRVSADVWNQRASLSMPDRGATRLHPEEISGIFKVMTTQVKRDSGA